MILFLIKEVKFSSLEFYQKKTFFRTTMNYPKKPSFNLYQSRHCAYITYSVKTWFLKILSLLYLMKKSLYYLYAVMFTERSTWLSFSRKAFLKYCDKCILDKKVPHIFSVRAVLYQTLSVRLHRNF